MKYLKMNNDLFGYLLKHNRLVHPVLEKLHDETKQLTMGNMQISQEQGGLMNLLAKTVGAKRCIEVGCFTGYSAICTALALPESGQLISLDINPEYAAVARKYFAAAGVQSKIDLRLTPALEALPALKKEFGPESFDFGFIDADKENQSQYYQMMFELIRPGGLILVDNVLWDGKVVLDHDDTPCTRAIRSFNKMIFEDQRIDFSLTALADGLTIIRKKDI